jgi:hypothetical protein
MIQVLGFAGLSDMRALHWSAPPPWRTIAKQNLYQPTGTHLRGIGMNLQ